MLRLRSLRVGRFGSNYRCLSIEKQWKELKNKVDKDNACIVVLDDDPTGCQTVYGINVLLDYSKESMKKELGRSPSLFYILTNTRALPESAAVTTTTKVLNNLHQAMKETPSFQKSIRLISRGDSTLRGHFPAELYPILEHPYFGDQYHGIILCPAFFEGGRITMNDIHYVKDAKLGLVPAAETPFAKDPHFPFSSSNLRSYILEKSQGRIPLASIQSISLQDIRDGDGGKEKLLSFPKNAVVIVNAEHQADLNTFMLALLQAEQENKRYLIRSAASFVSSRSGLAPQPLLDYSQRQHSKTNSSSSSGSKQAAGGLIVVGSYVPKTTAQVADLLETMDVQAVQLDVSEILEKLADLLKRQPGQPEQPYVQLLAENTTMQTLLTSYLQRIHYLLYEQQQHVVLYTQRTFHTGASIYATGFISYFITQIVYQLTANSKASSLQQRQPSFIIAKGGITSHEVAQYGLQMTEARVLGQIEPGIPVWQAIQTDQEQEQLRQQSDCLLYVVFPGNVGDDQALSRVAHKLGVPSKLQTSLNSSSNHQSVQFIQQQQPKKEKQKKTAVSRKPRSQEMLKTLQAARQAQQAIGAFNLYNLEGAKAVVEAAESLKSPVILQIHPSSLQYGGKPLIALLQSFQRSAWIPVFLHLDHSDQEKDILLALQCGMDSVMIDGSHLPYEENLAWTKKMAAIAHQEGVLVEAELGKLAGEEDGLSVDMKEMKMTDAMKAGLFVKETGVDLLAVTIGNVHGKYALPPQLDFPRLAAIREQLAIHNSEDSIPSLVLHGASGLPSSMIQQAITAGIVKFNVNTDLRIAALDYYKQSLSPVGGVGKRNIDILPMMQGVTNVMKDVAVEKIRLFQNKSK